MGRKVNLLGVSSRVVTGAKIDIKGNNVVDFERDVTTFNQAVTVAGPGVDDFPVINPGLGGQPRINYNAVQVIDGFAIAQHEHFNSGVRAATQYTVKAVDGGYFRFDPVSGGVDYDGALAVGDLTTPSVTVNSNQTADVDFYVQGATIPGLLTVDASADQVGIGTTTPAHLLDVNGNAGVQAIAYTPIAAASAPNLSTFVDSADNKLKYKNNVGTVFTVAG